MLFLATFETLKIMLSGRLNPTKILSANFCTVYNSSFLIGFDYQTLTKIG